MKIHAKFFQDGQDGMFLSAEKIKATIVLVVITTGFIFGSVVSAQEKARGLTISPLTFELSANPGDSLENKIKISNPTENSVSVRMEIEDFSARGELGQVTIEAVDNQTYSLKRWVKTNPAEFILEPKEQKAIMFIIDVPVNAEPGGKYGSILATITGTGSSTTGATVAQKVGALVLLSVSGEVKEELDIKEFSVPEFSEYGPVPFTILFENKGTVHVRPKGYIVITDLLGRKAAELEFPQKNVIPGAVRRVETEWNTKWLFGKYTASMIGVYGTSNENLTSHVVTFWVIPWKLMLIVLAVILFFLILIFLSRKRLRLAAKILLKGEHHHKN